MNKFIVYSLLSLSILSACSKEDFQTNNCVSRTMSSSMTKAIFPDAIYDENSGFYLVPHEDVYQLSKVQAVYEELTKKTDKLLPTHRALKFLPSDESTAHRILTDSTIWASRVPFGFRPVAQKREPEPDQFTLADTNILSSVCDLCDVNTGEGTPPEIAPIYVRWPIDRTIPSGVSYEVLYDIYTPSSSSKIDSLLSKALNPSIQSRGVRPDAGTHPAWMDPWSLKIRFKDNTLNSYRNAANIRVRYMDYYTYYSCSLITNASGKVFVPEDVPMLAVVYLEYYNNNFKITENNSANFYVEFIDIVDNLCDYPYSFEVGSPVTTLDYSYSFKRQVFQAARYYFKGHNDLLNNIEKIHLDDPLRIATYADSTSLHHSGIAGSAWYFGGSTPRYIEIANHSSASSFIFGTVLHELGHASHHTEVGYNYSSVTKYIKESFACFMGWYNVKIYYSNVLTTDYNVHNACLMGRQLWTGTSNYTPIYVDLVDDYNQQLEYGNTALVNDAINNIPVTDVLNFAIGPVTWAQTVALMQQKVGILYSSTDFNNMITYYSSL